MKGINFRLNSVVQQDAKYPLHLFFTEWLSDTCTERFDVIQNFDAHVINEYYTVYFDSSADELITRLKGPPPNLQKYIIMDEV